jgi:hypothetical protein
LTQKQDQHILCLFWPAWSCLSVRIFAFACSLARTGRISWAQFNGWRELHIIDLVLAFFISYGRREFSVIKSEGASPLGYRALENGHHLQRQGSLLSAEPHSSHPCDTACSFIHDLSATSQTIWHRRHLCAWGKGQVLADFLQIVSIAKVSSKSCF